MNIPRFLRCLAVLIAASLLFAIVGCETATDSSSAPYDPIVGVWTWTPRDHQVTVRRGGVATSSYGGRGTWQKISSNTYQFRWGSRFVDTLTLSDDANTLTGINQYGPQPNAFTRVGSAYALPPEAGNSYSSVGSSSIVNLDQGPFRISYDSTGGLLKFTCLRVEKPQFSGIQADITYQIVTSQPEPVKNSAQTEDGKWISTVTNSYYVDNRQGAENDHNDITDWIQVEKVVRILDVKWHYVD